MMFDIYIYIYIWLVGLLFLSIYDTMRTLVDTLYLYNNIRFNENPKTKYEFVVVVGVEEMIYWVQCVTRHMINFNDDSKIPVSFSVHDRHVSVDPGYI